MTARLPVIFGCALPPLEPCGYPERVKSPRPTICGARKCTIRQARWQLGRPSASKSSQAQSLLSASATPQQQIEALVWLRPLPSFGALFTLQLRPKAGPSAVLTPESLTHGFGHLRAFARRAVLRVSAPTQNCCAQVRRYAVSFKRKELLLRRSRRQVPAEALPRLRSLILQPFCAGPGPPRRAAFLLRSHLSAGRTWPSHQRLWIV